MVGSTCSPLAAKCEVGLAWPDLTWTFAASSPSPPPPLPFLIPSSNTKQRWQTQHLVDVVDSAVIAVDVDVDVVDLAVVGMTRSKSGVSTAETEMCHCDFAMGGY